MNSHGTGKLGPYGIVSIGELELQVTLHQEGGLPALRSSRLGAVAIRECRTWPCPVPPLLFKVSLSPEPSKAKREGKQRI